MKWFEIFAQLLPALFSLVPALRAHAKTAADATVTIADAAALGPMTQATVKASTLTLVRDGLTVANDELVAAGHAPIDHAAVTAAAASAIDTALIVTDLVHAAHGDGDAPAQHA